MAVESATYISQLVDTNPVVGDPVGEGDDHLRLIKIVLKTQFSGLTGTTAITPSEAELNYVNGVTSAIQTQMDTKGVGDAVLSADQTWGGSQRGTPQTITQGTLIDLDTGNNFLWTPAAADELSFANETTGQSGFIKLINPSAYVITLGSEVKAVSTFATDVTTAGTYLITYFSDGTNVYVSASGGSSLMTLLQSGITKSLAVSYDIDNSLRFNESDEAYLSWTPSATATSSKIFTVSCWVKRGEVDDERRIFTAADDGASPEPRTDFGFLGTGALTIGINPTGSTWYSATGSPFYRDPSAWYHIVWSMDTSQGTPADRSTLYVNGVEVTDFLSNNLSAGTPIPQDSTVLLGQSGMLQTVGAYAAGVSGSSFDGYIAEFYFVDGVEYAPAIFAETSETTNQWIPLDSDDVKDAVTFGTNGFYQKYGGTPGSVDAFTSTGADTWTCPAGVTEIELLTVAGGAGGGYEQGGGGGAGGLVYDTSYTVVPGVVYDLSVGTNGGSTRSMVMLLPLVGTDSVLRICKCRRFHSQPSTFTRL